MKELRQALIEFIRELTALARLARTQLEKDGTAEPERETFDV